MPTYASRQNRASLDHLVGAGEQGWRDREAERFCSFEIDRKLVLGRLLYRQIGGALAPLDALNIAGGPNKNVIVRGGTPKQPPPCPRERSGRDRKHLRLG